MKQPVVGMDRAEINAFGAKLQSIRLEGDDTLVSVAAHGPSVDCPNGYMLAVVSRGPDTGCGEAVSLDDAIRLARGQIRDAARARKKKRAEEKAALPTTTSHTKSNEGE